MQDEERHGERKNRDQREIQVIGMDSDIEDAPRSHQRKLKGLLLVPEGQAMAARIRRPMPIEARSAVTADRPTSFRNTRR